MFDKKYVYGLEPDTGEINPALKNVIGKPAKSKDTGYLLCDEDIITVGDLDQDLVREGVVFNYGGTEEPTMLAQSKGDLVEVPVVEDEEPENPEDPEGT